MMRIHLGQTVDSVNFHAEVDSIDEAEQFLVFLNKKATDAMDFTQRLPGKGEADLAAYKEAAAERAITNYSMTVKELLAPVFTRESLQPLVVSLAKERERFTGILNKFGVARFRDLPDEKLQAFGEACQAVAA